MAVDDLEVLEDIVGQPEPGAIISAGSESDFGAPHNGSMMRCRSAHQPIPSGEVALIGMGGG